ncbi:MAG TPA: CBS domain-containing protein [Candidatus Nanoarchaeia archaeon]|nr:CBS domain-containing protein [Candidatus Nanoarchaeia archaeon]
MEISSLEEVKRLRKKYNLTQKNLALRSGVSQSLIAKIEAGTIEPTFTKAQKIFEILEQARVKKEIKAAEVMHKKIFFAQSKELVKEVIKTMRKRGISQMPVLAGEKVCGLITERSILDKIAEDHSRLSLLRVENIMEDSPPIVSENTGLRALINLLHEYPAVLVAEKGEVKGIISKSDLLKKME